MNVAPKCHRQTAKLIVIGFTSKGYHMKSKSKNLSKKSLPARSPDTKRRIDTFKNRTERVVELMIMLQTKHYRIPLLELDEAGWGTPKTIDRMINSLNAIYGRMMGCDLVEIVRDSVDRGGDGQRYLQLVDKAAKDVDAIQLAAFPAYLNLLGTLKGTALEKKLTEQFANKKIKLTGSEKAYLDRLAKKFHFSGKGVKTYSGAHQATLNTVCDALLGERMLDAEVKVGGEWQPRRLKPLTLCLHNNGLYLMANLADSDPTKPPYTWKIESIRAAKIHGSGSFVYPLLHNAAQYLGEFGLMKNHGVTPISVEVAFDQELKDYICERQWGTGSKLTEVADGRIILSLRVSDLREITSFILSCSEHAEVLQPASLRQDVARIARAISKRNASRPAEATEEASLI